MLCKPFHLKADWILKYGNIIGKHFEMMWQTGRYLWYHIYIIKYFLCHLQCKTTGGLHQKVIPNWYTYDWKTDKSWSAEYSVLSDFTQDSNYAGLYSDDPRKIQIWGKIVTKLSNLHGKFCEMLQHTGTKIRDCYMDKCILKLMFDVVLTYLFSFDVVNLCLFVLSIFMICVKMLSMIMLCIFLMYILMTSMVLLCRIMSFLLMHGRLMWTIITLCVVTLCFMMQSVELYIIIMTILFIICQILCRMNEVWM